MKENDAMNTLGEEFRQGAYIIVPEGYPHCYQAYIRNPGRIFAGGVGALKDNPATLEACIIDKIDGLWNALFQQHDYFLVENDKEELILVRVTDELLHANSTLIEGWYE